MPRLLSSLLVVSACLVPAAAGDWPQFRGPQASGVGTGNPPTNWNVETGENIRWKVAVPGLGHAAPIITGDHVIILTAVPDGEGDVELTRGWEAADGHSASDPAVWSWRLYCYDRATGKQHWQQELYHGAPKTKRHPKASQANCTPATDGKHIVTFLGSEGLYCHDLDGKLLWQKDLGLLNSSPQSDPELQWGFSSSPVIYKDEVVVQCDCANTDFWAAFDLKTGKELRRVDRDEDATWSTPSVFEIDGKPQLVLNGYKHMGAYDLASGEELWKLSGGGDVPVPAPLYADGLIFLTNAHGANRPIYAINPRARGDLTPKDDAAGMASVPPTDAPSQGLAWWKEKRGSYIPTPIVYEHNLYICDDRGVFTVYDARTGEQHYRKRLAGGGANYTASAVASGGKLYFTNEDGEVHVVKAGDKYELLATNKMNEICMATPAIVDGDLFIRTRGHLYCVGK